MSAHGLIEDMRNLLDFAEKVGVMPAPMGRFEDEAFIQYVFTDDGSNFESYFLRYENEKLVCTYQYSFEEDGRYVTDCVEDHFSGMNEDEVAAIIAKQMKNANVEAGQ